MSYRHILCAVDLNDDNLPVAIRAAELVKQNNARLSLIHVVEYIPIDLANELVLPQQQEIEDQLIERSQIMLAKLSQELGLDGISENVMTGSTRLEIIKHADEQQVDLIVIGKHGRHGLSRLLGSTANAVLHHASCDVLTVFIGER